jgi:hypothetical protein
MDRDPSNYDATKDPIYLFKRKVYKVVSRPGWLGSDGDSWWIEHKNISGDDSPATWDFLDKGEVIESKLMHWLATNESLDGPYALEQWETESVWLTRKQAEEYGKSHEYNYPDGWKVYCVSAKGHLPDVLNDFPPAQKQGQNQIHGAFSETRFRC